MLSQMRNLLINWKTNLELEPKESCRTMLITSLRKKSWMKNKRTWSKMRFVTRTSKEFRRGRELKMSWSKMFKGHKIVNKQWEMRDMSQARDWEKRASSNLKRMIMNRRRFRGRSNRRRSQRTPRRVLAQEGWSWHRTPHRMTTTGKWINTCKRLIRA